MRTFRYLVSMAVWGVLFVVLGLPYFYMLRWIKPEPYQEHLFMWFAQWNQMWLRIAGAIAGLKVEYQLEGDVTYQSGDPVICVANHYGVIDAPLLIVGALKLGVRRVRGVSMQEARKWPIVGTILHEGRTAWMRRSRDPRDVQDLEVFAQEIDRDGDSAVIFPEGRVFEGTPHEGFRHLLKPKHRGFSALARNTGHRIVVATLIWHDYDAKKSRWLATIPPGDHCTVHGRIEWLANGKEESFLAEKWAEMDARIQCG